MRLQILVVLIAISLLYSCVEPRKSTRGMVITVELPSANKENLTNQLNSRLKSAFRGKKPSIIAQEANSITIDFPVYLDSTYLSLLLSGKALLELSAENGSQKKMSFADGGLDRINLTIDPYGRPALALQMENDYAKKFAVMTRENRGKQIDFALNDRVLFSPIVADVVSEGKVDISFDESYKAGVVYAAMNYQDYDPSEIRITDKKLFLERDGQRAALAPEILKDYQFVKKHILQDKEQVKRYLGSGQKLSFVEVQNLPLYVDRIEKYHIEGFLAHYGFDHDDMKTMLKSIKLSIARFDSGSDLNVILN
ncbi:MAG: hypothetical protein AAFX87_25375 [Bacteroidota bacterium]